MLYLSWNWLLKIKIIFIGWKQLKHKNVKLKWFIFRHLPSYDIWHEMLKRCRFIFTVIEATTLRSKLFLAGRVGFCCCYRISRCQIVSFCWLHVHWLILGEELCFYPAYSPLGSFSYAHLNQCSIDFFFPRLMNISLIKN